MKLSKLASAMPFAHYLGLSAARAEDDNDDERKQRDGESDDDYAKRMEEMDEEEKARKAEEEEKERARKAEEEEKEREAKRAKKAKRAEDDEDDADMEDESDDEEEGKRAGRAQGARQRERIRCARILAAGVKGGRVNQACVFAFDSALTAAAAVAALNAADLDAPKQTASRGSRLSERMSAVQTPNPGANSSAAPSADPAKALADRIVAVAERVRGK